MEKGYMEHIVQKAIDYGFEPITAIQMATLNVAEHFSLDAVVGGIAPGRLADLVVIPDVRTIKAEVVISNGSVIAENGVCLVTPRSHPWPQRCLQTVNLPERFKASDFRIVFERFGKSHRK